MEVLVDTSIWIDYFRGGDSAPQIDYLIDENLLVTNEVILAELIPYLKIKKQAEVVKLLNELKCLTLNIAWNEIIDYQVKCLQSGANGVGIPDLIIAQNAIKHHCEIYSLDKHFKLMAQILKVELFTLTPTST